MGRWRESNLQIPFIFLFEIKNIALYWKEGDEWEHFMIVEVIWEKRLSIEIWKWVVGWWENTQKSSRYVRDTKKISFCVSFLKSGPYNSSRVIIC